MSIDLIIPLQKMKNCGLKLNEIYLEMMTKKVMMIVEAMGMKSRMNRARRNKIHLLVGVLPPTKLSI